MFYIITPQIWDIYTDLFLVENYICKCSPATDEVVAAAYDAWSATETGSQAEATAWVAYEVGFADSQAAWPPRTRRLTGPPDQGYDSAVSGDAVDASIGVSETG